MGKFFLLLEKNNDHKRREYSTFLPVNFETREFSSVLFDFFPHLSVFFPIISDGNKISTDVFKIAWEEK